MKRARPAWLLLITNLPGRNQALRMRVWRALRAAGAGLLRDGVYLLPNSDAARKIYDQQVVEIGAAAGIAHIFTLDSDSIEQDEALAALFDRSAEYQELSTRLEACKKESVKLNELDARRRLARISRDVAASVATDYFPGQSQRQVRSALDAVEAALNARFSPGEPKGAPRKIPRLNAEDYKGRTWATRQHLWIDRVCSAWLIRRFIDPKAQFIWLKRPQDCPKRAVGFDFDGASFTHSDSRVTFEVLLATFGLEGDAALARLGTLVHFLDVGGLPVPEASGFASIVSGMRALRADDDALLKHVTPVIDGLYRAYELSSDGDAAQ